MIIRVSDVSHTGEARRHAVAQAERLNFGISESGALAIAVTEIATNLVKHAGGGSIIVEPTGRNGNRGLRVLALDKGPGIRDVASAMRDGHSTAGTAGNGLGAIRRLSDAFDIYSSPGSGTVILADFRAHKKVVEKAPAIEVGVISVPIKGEEVCGDGWGAKVTADSVLLMVVDGLGHGILASDAAREGERVFSESRTDSPSPILRDSHDAMRKTRGAAMAVASLHLDRRVVSFAGVGNISASIVSPEGSRGLASHNGTVGHHLQNIQEFTFPWNPNSLLIMHSDGLNTRWDAKVYPGIWNKHPALVAALLYRDFSRERDDVTVLVARNFQEASWA